MPFGSWAHLVMTGGEPMRAVSWGVGSVGVREPGVANRGERRGGPLFSPQALLYTRPRLLWICPTPLHQLGKENA